MAIIQSSYNHGFARYKGESQFPNLWDGLVACYDMGLGPTGGTLFDHAGRRLDGTLTNMDPATDWVVGTDGWVLNFSDTNDFAELSWPTNKLTGESPITFAGLARINVSPASSQFFLISTGDTTTGTQVNYNGGWRGAVGNAGDTGAGVTVAQGEWAHITFVFDGSSNYLYLNGILRKGPTACVPTYPPSTYVARLGGRQNASFSIRGDISKFGAWGRALTPAEIQQLYLGASPLTLRRRKRFFVSSDDALNLTATPAIFDWVSKDATLTLGPVNLPADPAVVTWVSKDAGITVGTANLSTDAAVVTWVAKDSVAVPDSVTISTTPAVVQWTAVDATIPGPAQLDAEVAIFEWIATDATATIFVPPNPPSSGLSANQCATRARASRAGGGTQATRIMPCSPSLARRSS